MADSTEIVAVEAASTAVSAATVALSAEASISDALEEVKDVQQAAIVETAETLVALATTQAALATTQAAEVIVEAEQAIAANEGSLEWLNVQVRELRQEMTTLSTLYQEILMAQQATLESQQLTPPQLENSQTAALPEVEPQTIQAAAIVEASPQSGAEESPDKQTGRKSKKIRFL